MRKVLIIVAAAMLLAAGCSGAGTPDSQLDVRTTAGSVKGTENGAVRLFQGLPYAQPPVGALRWASPRPPQPWQGTRAADKPGNRCPQAADSPGGKPSLDEDCLYLNVTTPARPGSTRPVMVWLHGGDGTGAGADYDTARLADQGDAVVVTVNYRIGALGNFALPQLGDNASFGTQDQLQALRWVKENAAAFGGDPGNVTVFGESSGAFATCALISSPQAKGLVERAIMESSSCSAYFAKNALAPGLGRHTLFTPLADAQAAGSAAAAKFGCDQDPDVLACLRRVPVRQWLDGGYTEVFTATPWGTSVLPGSPETAMRERRTLPIPVLFGSNQDELRLYVAAATAGGLKFDQPTYAGLLADTYGAASAAKITAAYPAQGPFAAALSWAAATTDDGWGCPTATDAQALASAGRPVYTYYFADRDAPPIPGYAVPPGFPLGAAHGLEMGYLFWDPKGTAPQQTLSRTMIGYWTNFARTGDPNGAGLPPWPNFSAGARVQRLTPDQVGPIDPQVQSKCSLWRQVGV
ncbi:carboxylesterase family protein [Amycolatopsis rhabdoformis]|uniref:Carboxylic ester hydrolase n=1 Tax=Amycolatopsis rhabdoformis TaxID=1448059 RepID=A0ABZ1I8Y9_9PSEU|nr:carboxylesterase family protein [Amycolatopsis rhabdoformis]WSE30378.1 carboxylesterase family protein [Amycolatopsis rhabdoformis]